MSVLGIQKTVDLIRYTGPTLAKLIAWLKKMSDTSRTRNYETPFPEKGSFCTVWRPVWFLING